MKLCCCMLVLVSVSGEQSRVCTSLSAWPMLFAKKELMPRRCRGLHAGIPTKNPRREGLVHVHSTMLPM